MKRALLLLGVLLFALPASLPAQTGCVEIKDACPLGREYFLYLPKQIDPDRIYWLVAGVHGRGGNGKYACGLADMVNHGRCLVVGPTFPFGHKVLASQSDTQLIGLFKLLASKYRLHPKIFVAGFSAGGQFTQRFVFKHPDQVIGCAPHSAGTWLTGDDGGDVKFDDSLAGRVPLAMSCGQLDVATTTRDEFTPKILKQRLDWAREFEALLQAKSFYFKAEYYPNVGHQWTPGARALTQETFDLSTTGLHARELTAVDALFAPALELIAASKLDDAKLQIDGLAKSYADLRAGWEAAETPAASEVAGWHSNAPMRSELRRRADAYVKERIAELKVKAVKP